MKTKKILLLTSIVLLFNAALFADLEDTKRNPIPGPYYGRCEKAGTTQLFKYKHGNFDRSTVVYTPYGYDPEDKETRYPVLYLFHGGGGASTSYLGPAGSPNQMCWIIDNAVMNGEMKPCIIVCPNHNTGFHLEFRKSLIPAIDEAFNTIPDRENRMVGGFSMGSVETWNLYMHALDLASKFIPMSGDSWVCGSTGGKTFPDKTAIVLTKADHIEEYKDSFLIFAATGTSDSAYENLTPQIGEMKNHPEAFIYTTEDFSKGNLIYYVVKGNVHSYTHTYEYIYNALKLFSQQ